MWCWRRVPTTTAVRFEQLTGELATMGRKVLLAPTDVTQVAQLRAMVDRTRQAFGRVDILVNNAAWTCTGLALDATEEEYDKTMAATMKSVFFACQAAARVMIPQGGGRIINIGSNFAVSAFKTRAIYAGGQGRRAPALARAVARVGPSRRRRQRRRALHHGDGVAQAILERPGYKAWVTKEKLPSGRWNQPEDIVGAVLFLASDLAAQVVGHVLFVDGGWTIG